jgi:hypothetical protein
MILATVPLEKFWRQLMNVPRNSAWNIVYMSQLQICEIRGPHDDDHGENYFLGCDAVYSNRCLPAWRMNVLPPSSESRSKSTKQASTNKAYPKISTI